VIKTNYVAGGTLPDIWNQLINGGRFQQHCQTTRPTRITLITLQSNDVTTLDSMDNPDGAAMDPSDPGYNAFQKQATNRGLNDTSQRALPDAISAQNNALDQASNIINSENTMAQNVTKSQTDMTSTFVGNDKPQG